MEKPLIEDVHHHYAGVLLVTQSGRVIGQRRDNKPGIDNPGKIGTFGGTVEPEEDPQQAAWRELVNEETNLSLRPSDIQPLFDDVAWRELTKEWEARHFYYAVITEHALNEMKVYEGQGWAEINSPDDPDLIELWRPVVQLLFERLNALQ